MKTLFISYDGLTDPLGESQILPYLMSLAQKGHRITVLSFEKPDRFLEGEARLRGKFDRAGLVWKPVRFTARPKYAAKAWDLLRMYFYAWRIARRDSIELVHCRSYQAAQTGTWLKSLTGCKVLFDIRGFWVDERTDGGIWKKENLFERFLYWFYKRIERKLYREADHIISLTEAAVPIIREMTRPATAVTVIPCCADFQHFNVLPAERRAELRHRLAIPSDGLVVGYVGSLGTWYLVEEMFRLLGHILKSSEPARALIVTRDWNEKWEALWSRCELSRFREQLVVAQASREEMPDYLNVCDVTLSFIKPAYSKIASSPTKIAESLAVGVPVIANPVGDVAIQIQRLGAGLLVEGFSEPELVALAEQLGGLDRFDRVQVRERACWTLSLETAARLYGEVYDKLGAR